MTNQISLALAQLEKSEHMETLFAVESGSRAWGFASADSDYDVRFVYRMPKDQYLAVTPLRDVIERPGDPMDLSGWDIKKFLFLLGNSNPSCFEWTRSPTLYYYDHRWAEVEDVLLKFFSPRKVLPHYISMAKHNYREHMRGGQSDRVRLKKYLYIMRPLLCARWIEQHPGEGPPPMPLYDVMLGTEFPCEVWAILHQLVIRKQAGDELSEGPVSPILNGFIDREIVRLTAFADTVPHITPPLGELDEVFRRTIE